MANDQFRETEWRQGMVLEPKEAIRLGLIEPAASEGSVVVMVTHDCDIASDASREPEVEVIVGKRISALGADTNAKTARRLHLAFETSQGSTAVELQAIAKVKKQKIAVLSATPLDWKLAPAALVTLQNWLAARYSRSAFANEFESRLKDKSAKLDKKIIKALEKPSAHVLAVLFNVDGGLEKRRVGEVDVYQLHITLLYDSTLDEPAAFAAAQNAADAIETAFEEAFFVDGVWKNIHLLSCLPVSDAAMSIAQGRVLKQWRLDYMSLDSDPVHPMLT